MLIGIISDTHNQLPAEVFDIFKEVDYIIHAGDIGDISIVDDLKALAPVRAVYGNMDQFPVVTSLNNMDFFTLGGKKFCLTHMISTEKAFAFFLYKMNKKVDIVIYGHTHRPEHGVFNRIHFINPGSASNPREVKNGSVALLNIENGRMDVSFQYIEKSQSK